MIGGAAGAIPPLVGFAAASGNLTVSALLLFAVVFFWTPPHFWALALLIQRDYEAAGVPMLPVVRGERETTKQIVLYSLALVAVSASPFLLGTLGLPYLVVALILGAAFLALALGLRLRPTPRRAALLFHFSLFYLALLFRPWPWMSHCERASQDVSKEVCRMSDVTSGAVMTLVVPLSLLVLVLVLWAVAYRRSQRRATADATTPEP